MILFSGLSRFSGHFCGNGLNPLNRDTTVVKCFMPKNGSYMAPKDFSEIICC